MSDENYRKAIQDAMHETTALLAKRNEIDKRLTQLKATVHVLSGLLEESPKADEAIPDIEDLGVSQAIRHILSINYPDVFTPAQLKAKLIESGFDLTKYSNPSAVIHNTLKRLEAQKEVTPINTPSGVAYTVTPQIKAKAIELALAEIERRFKGERGR